MLHFQQTLNPLTRAGVGDTCPCFLAFVEPMSGDAVVGHIFHFVGSDLDFNGHAVHAFQHGVQRLVAVCLGNGDVVLKLTGHGLIEAVHHAQSAIAVIHRVDDQAEGKDIHYLREGFPLGLHLVVDTIEMLFPSHDGGIETLAVQGLAQLPANLVNQLRPVATR